MKFAERHAQIDANPLRELERRTSFWACVPDEKGGTLQPEARIVPYDTIRGTLRAVDDLKEQVFWLRIIAGVSFIAIVTLFMVR